jgi:hypothetical protein
LKDILETCGIPLSEDDQDLYRVHLQSKLLEDTRKLCQQLEELQSIVPTHATIWDESDNDFNSYDGAEEFKMMLTPQEAHKKLMVVLVRSENLCKYMASENSNTSSSSSTCLRAPKYCNRASPKVNANAQLLIEHAESIRVLWLSRTVQNLCVLQKIHPLWHRLATFKHYSRADILRIVTTSFRPQPQDLAGINLPFPVITYMRVDGMDFEIHDIGGMSVARRRKFVRSFDHADLFLFVAALSHYDLPVAPTTLKSCARVTNRLVAAMDEFAYFLNQKVPSRRQSQPILLLTDNDMFTAKLQHSSLSKQPPFSEFQGNSLDGVAYITQKFKMYVPDNAWDAVQVTGSENQCSLQFLIDTAQRILMMEVSA